MQVTETVRRKNKGRLHITTDAALYHVRVRQIGYMLSALNVFSRNDYDFPLFASSISASITL